MWGPAGERNVVAGAAEERRREPVPCEGLGHGGQPVLAAA